MNRLLNIEITKLLSYSTFWILTGIAGGFYVLLLIAAAQVNFDLAGIDINVYFRFPVVWQTISYYSSWYNLLLALLIIIITANDFAFRTMRQHIIDGLSKQEVFISKLLLILLFSAFAFVVNLIAAFFTGSVFTQGFHSIFSDFYFVILYFINVVGIMSIAFFVSILLKNVAASIVVFIGFYIFELILRAYFSLMSLNIAQFLPFKVLSNLCTAPSLKKMISDPMIKQSLEYSIQKTPDVWEMPIELNVILALVYISIFLFLAYTILQKRDL